MFGSHRAKTDAYKVSEEINEKLHNEESFFYKPWQFKNYAVHAVTLKTTYDEVNIWGRQCAMIRPGWKVEEGMVFVPNLFAKISGVHNSVSNYRREMKMLVKQPNTLIFKRFPLFIDRKISYINSKYYMFIDRNGIIDKSKLISSSYWKYRSLNVEIQNCIIDRIEDFCRLYRFKNYESCYMESSAAKFDGIFKFLKTFDINVNLTGSVEDMAKVKIFETLCNIEEPLLRLISNFDYPGYVPKIIIYNNGNSYSKITFADAVRLMFMNTMGVDIIIYNPAGYMDIEDFIYEEYYDIHNLEKVEFNLPYKRWLFF